MCNWPECRRETELVWLGRQLCGKHWAKLIELQEHGKTNDELRAMLSGRKTSTGSREAAKEEFYR